MARVAVTSTVATASMGSGARVDQVAIARRRDGKVAEAWEIADLAALQAQVANPSHHKHLRRDQT